MQQKIAICAGVLALAVTASGGGLAQPAPLPYPGTVHPDYGPAVPPYEIITIVRSSGFEPLSRPIRQGPAYALRALDPAGQEVRVIVDARMGRIVKVAPLMAPRYAVMPPPYGRPPRPIPMVPDGYGPNARIAGLAPGVEGPAPNGLGGLPAGPGHAPPAGALQDPAAQAGPPPLPRPRPKVASTDAPPATGTAPAQGGAKESKEKEERTGTIPAPATPVEMHE